MVKLLGRLCSFSIIPFFKGKIGEVQSAHCTSVRIWVQVIKRFFSWEKIELSKSIM